MKLTNILLMIVIVVISVVGYFAVTEERLCETESTDSNYMEGHAGHQLNNLLAQRDGFGKLTYHRYLK